MQRSVRPRGLQVTVWCGPSCCRYRQASHRRRLPGLGRGSPPPAVPGTSPRRVPRASHQRCPGTGGSLPATPAAWSSLCELLSRGRGPCQTQHQAPGPQQGAPRPFLLGRSQREKEALWGGRKGPPVGREPGEQAGSSRAGGQRTAALTPWQRVCATALPRRSTATPCPAHTRLRCGGLLCSNAVCPEPRFLPQRQMGWLSPGPPTLVPQGHSEDALPAACSEPVWRSPVWGGRVPTRRPQTRLKHCRPCSPRAPKEGSQRREEARPGALLPGGSTGERLGLNHRPQGSGRRLPKQPQARAASRPGCIITRAPASSEAPPLQE